MPKEGLKRKLTAILSADVEGYSRLMGNDEASTIHTLTAYKETMSVHIKQHRGRVVDAPGDNLLAEFASVVDAVQCAVEIQQDLAERNEDLPDERKMVFRIGVNLGDVVEEDDRIYGDGVNIAARLESICDGGGVCISGTAFEHVENKLDLEYENLGDHEVKNIEKPVRVYRVLSYPGDAAHRNIKTKGSVQKKRRNAILAVVSVLIVALGAAAIWKYFLRPPLPILEAASVEKMAFPLPDIPSIAVLPFINMSEDPNQEYFSDGITEDIITDLSKISDLLVISRSSTFAYKNKLVKIKQVAEEFGVRYVLEGSVRKVSDKVRINAQLIDAITGHHLWAERYDRDLKDIFALQNEITRRIASTLKVEVEAAELKRIRRIPTENLNAYEIVLRGMGYFRDHDKANNALARQMFKQAIELDPAYAKPHWGLGVTYFRDWFFFWTEDPKAPERALGLVLKAIELDDTYAPAYGTLGWIYLWKDRQYEQAIDAAKKAIALDPNYAGGYNILAEIYNSADEPKKVFDLIGQAIRLNPRYPVGYLFQMGRAYYFMGKYVKSIETMKRLVARTPKHMGAHMVMAACYVELGQEEEARAEAAEVLNITPNLRLINDFDPHKDPAVEERFVSNLRKAGLK
jgi:adenylate cyclase